LFNLLFDVGSTQFRTKFDGFKDNHSIKKYQ